MKIFTAQNKTIYRLFIFLPLCILFLLINGLNNKVEAINAYTLDKNSCNHAIDDMIGRYSIKVGGKGMFNEHNSSGKYQGTFEVNNVNGSIQKAYLYWTLRKPSADASINLKVNSGPERNLNAHQVFGPAKLYTDSTTYWGYIIDLTSTGASGDLKTGVNSFTITKQLGTDTNVEFFGVGALIIHNDPSLSRNQHIEVKCGFDATYYDDIGNVPSITKWGEWSNVVCHRFVADSTSPSRQVKYYAFMSGTKKKSTAPPVYRPNAFWYITGTAGSADIPSSIKGLNKSGSTPNQGLKGISGSREETDLFDALSGNEWDTIDSTKGDPDIEIPRTHDYICFQTQSINRSKLGQYGMGSSMQWSMSALSFMDSSGSTEPTPTSTSTPTPTPDTPGVPTATATPTPTPTPVVYYPWANTVGGNVFSRTFNQTLLRDGQTITNTSASFDGREAYLSSDLYLQPIGIAVPRPSERNAQLSNYSDANSVYKPGVSWFSYFNQYFQNSGLEVILSPITSSTLNHNSTAQIHPSGDLSKVAVHTYSGTLHFDINECNTKSIFLVDGNLTVNPDFVNSGFDNGCMFIVSGTTTILEGNNLGSSDSPPNTNYDQVHGYFVTHTFAVGSDPARDGLFIKGGVVETAENASGTENMDLNRTLGTPRNRYSPSEVIEYDPRYLYIYGDLLSYIYGYNIREKQFIITVD